MGIKSILIISLVFNGLGAAYYFSTAQPEILSILSTSFILLSPICLGIVAGMLGAKYKAKKTSLYFITGLYLFLGLTALYLWGQEAALCILIASPIIFLMCWIGVVLGSKINSKIKSSHFFKTLFIIGISPYLFQLLENRFPAPEQIEKVVDRVIFKSTIDPQIIWDEFVSVDPIAPRDIPNKWIYYIGFPKPLSAEIDKYSLGGVRKAIFQKNVSFHEKVTKWNPPLRLKFDIEADPEFIPASAFDRHIIIGGRMFDVLDGEYEVLVEDHRTILRLTSHHRISSWYSGYTRLWTRDIMHRIQRSILTVIERRVHSAHVGSGNQRLSIRKKP